MVSVSAFNVMNLWQIQIIFNIDHKYSNHLLQSKLRMKINIMYFNIME